MTFTSEVIPVSFWWLPRFFMSVHLNHGFADGYRASQFFRLLNML